MTSAAVTNEAPRQARGGHDERHSKLTTFAHGRNPFPRSVSLPPVPLERCAPCYGPRGAAHNGPPERVMTPSAMTCGYATLRAVPAAGVRRALYAARRQGRSGGEEFQVAGR